MANDPYFYRQRRYFDKPSDYIVQATSTLASPDLIKAVQLPPGEDTSEWLAVNARDFLKQIKMLYGTLTDHCTDATCPTMTAGPRFEYAWTQNGMSVPCTAPVYIDYLFTSIQDELDNENVFPSQIGKPFPQNFTSIVQTIMRRLFRVYAHVYNVHFDAIKKFNAVSHLNTSFMHFMHFVQQFNLISPTDLEPLQVLIKEIVPYANNGIHM